jgi:hypothetical protein
MALNYLVLADTKAKLISYGIEAVDLPVDPILIDTIEDIESRIDSYLGFFAGNRRYVEEKVSNETGVIFMTKYPVTSVVSVNAFLPVFPLGSQPTVPTQMFEAISLWDKTNALLIGFANVNCQIEYFAGDADEDLLARVQRVAFETLRQALLNALPGEVPTLEFLNEPTADETSLSLPGGLSHSLTLGQPGSGGNARGIAGKGTVADRLFATLSTYRRLYRL